MRSTERWFSMITDICGCTSTNNAIENASFSTFFAFLQPKSKHFQILGKMVSGSSEKSEEINNGTGTRRVLLFLAPWKMSSEIILLFYLHGSHTQDKFLDRGWLATLSLSFFHVSALMVLSAWRTWWCWQWLQVCQTCMPFSTCHWRTFLTLTSHVLRQIFPFFLTKTNRTFLWSLISSGKKNSYFILYLLMRVTVIWIRFELRVMTKWIIVWLYIKRINNS